MAQNKKLELFVCVTEKLDVEDLFEIIPKDSKEEKYLFSLELLIGYFSWPDDIMINQPFAENNREG